MKHLEADIETTVCRKALDRGVKGIKLKSDHETGLPDRMFLIPGGRPLFMEFKRDASEEPTPKQLWWHDLLRALGYQVEVHYDVDRALSSIARAVAAAQLPEEGDEVAH